MFNSANADRACAHNSHCGSNRDSNQMSDCHDRLHPADDRRNQSATAMGGNAEKLTNHVMGVTARPRIQSISERFRSGNGSKGPRRDDAGWKGEFQMMGVFAEFEPGHDP